MHDVLMDYTYGLDIIAQVGWWRDREHLTRQEAHKRLIEKGVQSSEREVDNLYTHYQVLMACTHSGKQRTLEQAVKERGGLIVGLDGLAPEGASEQLWIVREVQTDTILVAAWLERVDHKTLQSLLKPVQGVRLGDSMHSERQTVQPQEGAGGFMTGHTPSVVSVSLSGQPGPSALRSGQCAQDRDA